jgi:hypothetical protein
MKSWGFVDISGQRPSFQKEISISNTSQIRFILPEKQLDVIFGMHNDLQEVRLSFMWISLQIK